MNECKPLPAAGTPLNLSGPSFQAPDTNSTPLIVAAWCGHIDIVRMLLTRAPNTTVDYVDASRHGATSVGFTALAVAAQFHHADVIRLLAEWGASVGRGLHSSTSQPNLSRVCHKKTSYIPSNTPYYPLSTGYTIPTRTPYPIQSAQVEQKRGRV